MMISYNIYIFLSNRQGNIFRVWCSADIRVFSSSCLMKYSKIVSKKNRSAIEIDSSSGWSSTMSHWQWGGGCCLLSFERSIDTQWHSCWSDRSTSRSTPSSAVGVVCFLVCLFFVVFWKILVFISSYPTFGRGRQPLGPTPAAYLTFPTPEVHFGSFNVHRCSRRTWLTTVNFRSLLPF